MLVHISGVVAAVDLAVAVAGVACESHHGTEEANDASHDADAK